MLVLYGQENGTCPEYELASEGVNQALLAGQLFLKASTEIYSLLHDLFFLGNFFMSILYSQN